MPNYYNNLISERLEEIVKKYLKYCIIERGLSPKTVTNKKEALNRLNRYFRSICLSLGSLGEYRLYKLACQRGPAPELEGKDFPLSLCEVVSRAVQQMDEQERSAFNNHLIEISERFGPGGP